MAGAREIIAGRAAIIVRADDQSGKGLSSVEGRVSRTLAKLGTNFVRIGSSGSGGDLTKTMGTLRSGFAGLAAAAGPAGIATAAVFGAAALAANKLVETVQRGAEVIRSLAAEAAKAGVSIEQLTGGRITDADVERIKLMDSAASELKKSIDLVAASIASEFAPAVTRITTAMGVGVSVAASYGGQLASLLGTAVALAAQLSTVARMVGVVGAAVGASNIGEDLDELANLQQKIAEGNAKIAAAQAKLAQTRKSQADFFKGLESERDLVGATEDQKVIAAAKELGILDKERLDAAVKIAQETRARKEALEANAKAAADAAAIEKEALEATETLKKTFEDRLSSLQLENKLIGLNAAERAREEALAQGLGEHYADALAAQVAMNEEAREAIKNDEKRLELAEKKAKEAEREAEADAKKDSDAIFAEQQRRSSEADRFAEQIKESLKTPAQKFKEFEKDLRDSVDSGRLTQGQANGALLAERARLAGEKLKDSTSSRTSSGTFNPAALLSLQGGSTADRTAKATEATAKYVKKIADNPAGIPFG